MIRTVDPGAGINWLQGGWAGFKAGGALLIGMVLIADGFGQSVPKGYIYFAMGFAVFIELMNLRVRKTQEPPVRLHEPQLGPPGST